MEPVESSALSGMVYDAQEERLYVEFPNGKRFVYYDVPQAIFVTLKVAESKGRFFGQHIKGKFRYKEVPKHGEV
jgi:hypothetical protein